MSLTSQTFTIKLMPTKTLIANRKSLIVLLVTSLIFLLLSSNFSLAQTLTPLERARQDYTFQLTKYEESKNPYENARANYLTFQTAVAKNEAFLKSQAYLLQIYNVYTAYLFLINERTNLYDWGKSSYNKDELQITIDEEIESLENLKSKTQEFKTLEEIVINAQDLKKHIETKTLPLAFKMLSTTDVVQSQETFFDFQTNSQKVNDYASGNIAENYNLVLLNWQNEVEKLKKDTEAKIEESKIALEKITGEMRIDSKSNDFPGKLKSAERENLRNSKGRLREILEFL